MVRDINVALDGKMHEVKHLKYLGLHVVVGRGINGEVKLTMNGRKDVLRNEKCV